MCRLRPAPPPPRLLPSHARHPHPPLVGLSLTRLCVKACCGDGVHLINENDGGSILLGQAEHVTDHARTLCLSVWRWEWYGECLTHSCVCVCALLGQYVFINSGGCGGEIPSSPFPPLSDCLPACLSVPVSLPLTSPRYFCTNSLPTTLMKAAVVWCATALANMVLPEGGQQQQGGRHIKNVWAVQPCVRALTCLSLEYYSSTGSNWLMLLSLLLSVVVVVLCGCLYMLPHTHPHTHLCQVVHTAARRVVGQCPAACRGPLGSGAAQQPPGSPASGCHSHQCPV